MRYKSFRFFMLVGAAALIAVALYYFVNYAVVLDIALGNSGIRASLAASIRALWLAFACQALLIGLLVAVVAFRPPAVSREVVVLFGLLELAVAVMLFSFAGNRWMALLLVAAAICVLLGAVLWPKNWQPLPRSTPAPEALPEAGTGFDLPPVEEKPQLPGPGQYPHR